MAAITIFHGPACGTSRSLTALIRSSGVEPTFVEHLKHPSGRERLLPLLTSMNKPVCQLLRRPLETVLGLLTNPLRDAFTNEDGKVVIDSERRRVTR